MKMPFAESAELPMEKVTDYLLSFTHPLGRHKARFFRRLGFTPDRAAALASALLEIAVRCDVAETSSNIHGTKYVIEGRLEGPAGEARVCTVWIQDRDYAPPRFVTAYPAQ